MLRSYTLPHDDAARAYFAPLCCVKILCLFIALFFDNTTPFGRTMPNACLYTHSRVKNIPLLASYETPLFALRFPLSRSRLYLGLAFAVCLYIDTKFRSQFACSAAHNALLFFTRFFHAYGCTCVRIPERKGTCLSRHAMPAISSTGCTSPTDKRYCNVSCHDGSHAHALPIVSHLP